MVVTERTLKVASEYVVVKNFEGIDFWKKVVVVSDVYQ